MPPNLSFFERRTPRTDSVDEPGQKGYILFTVKRIER